MEGPQSSAGQAVPLDTTAAERGLAQQFRKMVAMGAGSRRPHKQGARGAPQNDFEAGVASAKLTATQELKQEVGQDDASPRPTSR